MSHPQQDVLLYMDHITKRFPGSIALDDARLQVMHSEVHALIGENGAGKSTLIKVLTGVYRRDSGTILFDGKTVNFQSPQHAQMNGISTIYQEVNLIPYRTVTENIFLGRERYRWGILDWRRMNSEAEQMMRRFHITLDVTQPLNTYTIATQQMVAIARALSFKSKLVIMDEPTSSLSDDEVQVLFEAIRLIKSEGISVIFVSHRLDELYAICDQVTIMRDGRTIDERELSGLPKIELVAKMLGREIGAVQHEGQTSFNAARHNVGAEKILEARDLHRGRMLQDVSLSVNRGEIVGLAGLLGSGRSETARAIFGADALVSGEVLINGTQRQFHQPAEAIRAGIGFCSEDRKSDGIIPELSVRENLTLAALPMLTRAGIVDRQKQQEIVDQFIQQLGIKTTGPDQKIRELSGGNQQKVLLARWLCLHPQLLILDEPTRGIDVGAKGEIQKLIDTLAEEGLAVLMISSEMEELLEGSDRVFVLRDGKTVAEIPREQLSQDGIMHAMAHGETDPETGGVA